VFFFFSFRYYNFSETIKLTSPSPQVSDNDDVRHAGGGSHWSLLLYVAPDAPGALDGGTFEHFDSMHGRNDEKAFALAGTLAAANALPGCRDVSVGGSFTKHHDVAQQRNGYDCGIFALATAETCVRVFTAEKIQKNSLASIVAEDVSQETVRDMRGELLRLVERLTEENT
jgi:Ulp1 family protease